MKKLYRNILLSVAFILFFSIAPLLILYAIGYRLPSQTDLQEAVGVLYVETFPRRADVIINDEMRGRTPRAFQNISDDIVSVTIQKDGYRQWQKNIPIEPTQVTELRGVRLFPETIIPQEINQNIATHSLSPNRQLLVTVSHQNNLKVIDTNTNDELTSLSLPQATKFILWSPNSALLLIRFANNSLATLDISQLTEGIINLPELKTAQQISWDPRVPGRLLAVDSKNNLFAYNVSSQTKVNLIENVINFVTSSRNIIVINSDGQLSAHTFRGSLIEDPKNTFATPVEKLLVTPAGHIALITQGGVLSLISEEDEVIKISDNVLSAGWSPDGSMLLLQTDKNSIHIYNVTNDRSPIPLQQLQLVTRLSQPIMNPQWFAGGQHILYQVEDQIVITEIDTRDHPISFVVDSTNLGSSLPMVGEDGESVYYLKSTNGVTSLVIAPLIIE